MSISFSSINQTLHTVAQKMETNLANTLQDISSKEDPTTADMVKMQQEMQQWTLMIQTQSTMVKELGDTLKGIVQKAA